MTLATSEHVDKAQINYQQARMAYWDSLARRMDTRTSWGRYYRQRLMEIYQFLIAPGQRVIEIGCAQGDLLAAVRPSLGVGVDFSVEMIQRATQRHPRLHFVCADVYTLTLNQKFDVIILSDLINDLWDVQTAFQQIAQLTTPRTRIIINSYIHLWEPALGLVDKLSLAKPTLYQAGSRWKTSLIC